MIVLKTLIEAITFLVIAIITIVLLNYIFNKDFKSNLVNKIKRVISSQQSNKITQIKKLIYNYFF